MNKIVLVDNEITINVDDSIEVETLDRFIDVKKMDLFDFKCYYNNKRNLRGCSYGL